MCAKLMVQVWIFKMWYDNIGDIERADVSVLDEVISVSDGYKPRDLPTDEIRLTIEIICTNGKHFHNVHCF